MSFWNSIPHRLGLALLWGDKDGGPESRVRMWGLECKRLGSILVLRFEPGTREAFHTHAFNAWSWVLWGSLYEDILPGKPAPESVANGLCWSPGDLVYVNHYPSLRPIHTPRRHFHKVAGGPRGAWALSFRGPWWAGWREYDPSTGNQTKLAQGRQERP
jgi:hypothetical protein